MTKTIADGARGEERLRTKLDNNNADANARHSEATCPNLMFEPVKKRCSKILLCIAAGATFYSHSNNEGRTKSNNVLSRVTPRQILTRSRVPMPNV